jgi:hypothetical protein
MNLLWVGLYLNCAQKEHHINNRWPSAMLKTNLRSNCYNWSLAGVWLANIIDNQILLREPN